MLTDATYPDDEVATERDRLVDRIQVARASRARRPRRRCCQAHYGDHPYAVRCRPADEVAAVDRRRSCARCTRAACVRGGSTLVLVGDLDPETAIDDGEQRSAAGRRDHRRTRAAAAARRCAAADLLLVDRPGSVQSSLRIARRRVGRGPTPTTPRCSWPTWSSAATSPPAGGEHPRGQGLHLQPALVDRVRRRRRGAAASRPTWPPRSPPPRCWRPGTSWAGWPPAADGRRAGAGPPVRARHAADSLSTQAGLASTLSALAGVGLDASWLRRTRPSGGGHGRRGRGRGAAFFAPAGVTGVVVGDLAVLARSCGRWAMCYASLRV